MKQITSIPEAKKEIKKYTHKDIEITIDDIDNWVLCVYFTRRPNLDKYNWFFAYCDMNITLEDLRDRDCEYNYRLCFTESLKHGKIIVFNKIGEKK